MHALALAAAIVATPADDRFEQNGRNVFVVEGIAGIASYRTAYPDEGIDDGRVQVGALGMLPFTRLGYHRFIGRGFSLGLGAQFLRARGGLYYDDETTVWGATPRIGWSTPITSSTSFWLRAGPGVLYAKTERTNAGQLSLGGEAIVMFIPSRDFGVMMTTFFDSGFAGREVLDGTTTGRSVRLQTFGVALGVAIAF